MDITKHLRFAYVQNALFLIGYMYFVLETI